MRNFWFASSVIFSVLYFYLMLGTIFGFVEPNATTQVCGCYFVVRYWMDEAFKTWKEMKVENNG